MPTGRNSLRTFIKITWIIQRVRYLLIQLLNQFINLKLWLDYICKWHTNNSNEFSNTICKRQPINHSISLNEHEKLNDSNNLRNQRGKNLSSFECKDDDGSFDSALFSSLSTQLKRVFNKHMYKRRVFQLEDHNN